jgi:hypothetical protein
MRNSGRQPVYKAFSGNCPVGDQGALGKGRNGKKRPQVCPAVPVRKLAFGTVRPTDLHEVSRISRQSQAAANIPGILGVPILK